MFKNLNDKGLFLEVPLTMMGERVMPTGKEEKKRDSSLNRHQKKMQNRWKSEHYERVLDYVSVNQFQDDGGIPTSPYKGLLKAHMNAQLPTKVQTKEGSTDDQPYITDEWWALFVGRAYLYFFKENEKTDHLFTKAALELLAPIQTELPSEQTLQALPEDIKFHLFKGFLLGITLSDFNSNPALSVPKNPSSKKTKIENFEDLPFAQQLGVTIGGDKDYKIDGLKNLEEANQFSREETLAKNFGRLLEEEALLSLERQPKVLRNYLHLGEKDNLPRELAELWQAYEATYNTCWEAYLCALEKEYRAPDWLIIPFVHALREAERKLYRVGVVDWYKQREPGTAMFGEEGHECYALREEDFKNYENYFTQTIAKLISVLKTHILDNIDEFSPNNSGILDKVNAALKGIGLNVLQEGFVSGDGGYLLDEIRGGRSLIGDSDLHGAFLDQFNRQDFKFAKDDQDFRKQFLMQRVQLFVAQILQALEIEEGSKEYVAYQVFFTILACLSSYQGTLGYDVAKFLSDNVSFKGVEASQGIAGSFYPSLSFDPDKKRFFIEISIAKPPMLPIGDGFTVNIDLHLGARIAIDFDKKSDQFLTISADDVRLFSVHNSLRYKDKTTADALLKISPNIIKNDSFIQAITDPLEDAYRTQFYFFLFPKKTTQDDIWAKSFSFRSELSLLAGVEGQGRSPIYQTDLEFLGELCRNYYGINPFEDEPSSLIPKENRVNLSEVGRRIANYIIKHAPQLPIEKDRERYRSHRERYRALAEVAEDIGVDERTKSSINIAFEPLTKHLRSLYAFSTGDFETEPSVEFVLDQIALHRETEEEEKQKEESKEEKNKKKKRKSKKEKSIDVTLLKTREQQFLPKLFSDYYRAGKEDLNNLENIGDRLTKFIEAQRTQFTKETPKKDLARYRALEKIVRNIKADLFSGHQKQLNELSTSKKIFQKEKPHKTALENLPADLNNLSKEEKYFWLAYYNSDFYEYFLKERRKIEGKKKFVFNDDQHMTLLIRHHPRLLNKKSKRFSLSSNRNVFQEKFKQFSLTSRLHVLAEIARHHSSADAFQVMGQYGGDLFEKMCGSKREVLDSMFSPGTEARKDLSDLLDIFNAGQLFEFLFKNLNGFRGPMANILREDVYQNIDQGLFEILNFEITDENKESKEATDKTKLLDAWTPFFYYNTYRLLELTQRFPRTAKKVEEFLWDEHQVALEVQRREYVAFKLMSEREDVSNMLKDKSYFFKDTKEFPVSSFYTPEQERQVLQSREKRGKIDDVVFSEKRTSKTDESICSLFQKNPPIAHLQFVRHLKTLSTNPNILKYLSLRAGEDMSTDFVASQIRGTNKSKERLLKRIEFDPRSVQRDLRHQEENISSGMEKSAREGVIYKYSITYYEKGASEKFYRGNKTIPPIPVFTVDAQEEISAGDELNSDVVNVQRRHCVIVHHPLAFQKIFAAQEGGFRLVENSPFQDILRDPEFQDAVKDEKKDQVFEKEDLKKEKKRRDLERQQRREDARKQRVLERRARQEEQRSKRKEQEESARLRRKNWEKAVEVARKAEATRIAAQQTGTKTSKPPQPGDEIPPVTKKPQRPLPFMKRRPPPSSFSMGSRRRQRATAPADSASSLWEQNILEEVTREFVGDVCVKHPDVFQEGAFDPHTVPAIQKDPSNPSRFSWNIDIGEGETQGSIVWDNRREQITFKNLPQGPGASVAAGQPNRHEKSLETLTELAIKSWLKRYEQEGKQEPIVIELYGSRAEKQIMKNVYKSMCQKRAFENKYDVNNLPIHMADTRVEANRVLNRIRKTERQKTKGSESHKAGGPSSSRFKS